MKDFLIEFINKAIRRLFDKKSRDRRRLAKLPRYKNSKALLLGKQIDITDNLSFLWGFEEIFSKKVYQFEAKNDEPVIIDCGANIGMSIIYLKTLYPKARIVGFEPDPKIFNILENNIFLFGFSDVQLYQKAIWNSAQKILFRTEGGLAGRVPKPGDTMNIIEVDGFRLRDLLDKKIDFLKIDIEGAESVVIEDCKEQLNNVENIFIEYHSHAKEHQTLHRILEILYRSGFRYHVKEEFARQKPFLNRNLLSGMDLQLNIYGYRDG